MIKPDAFGKGHTGAILDQIIGAGFRIWIGLASARGQKTKFQFKILVISSGISLASSQSSSLPLFRSLDLDV